MISSWKRRKEETKERRWKRKASKSLQRGERDANEAWRWREKEKREKEEEEKKSEREEKNPQLGCQGGKGKSVALVLFGHSCRVAEFSRDLPRKEKLFSLFFFFSSLYKVASFPHLSPLEEFHSENQRPDVGAPSLPA